MCYAKTEMETNYREAIKDNQVSKEFVADLRTAKKIIVTFIHDQNTCSADFKVTVKFMKSVTIKKQEIECWSNYNDAFYGYSNLSWHQLEKNLPPPRSAHFFGMYPNGQWQALKAILKPNDILTFEFRENSSGYLESAGLHHDELLVTVKRNGTTIINRMMLEWSCCPENTARAIKY